MSCPEPFHKPVTTCAKNGDEDGDSAWCVVRSALGTGTVRSAWLTLNFEL